ncbi:hypothetical protein EDM56_14240 [Brevibacillus fluminis]|uniref:PhnB-like domain-containing protein n=1 Tax=Brevibacillus fluminis TaxID=511487 RepID=A0A3M8DIB5_9BACL|nr:hypothetical protein EDM56_14240 [Brevibacillus fluminis]
MIQTHKCCLVTTVNQFFSVKWGTSLSSLIFRPQVCGWLKDKFGVSWQIVPSNLTEMLCNPDPERAERVMKALLETKAKINMRSLKQAFEG